MNNPEIQEKIKDVKTKIEKLIEEGNLTEANNALEKCYEKMPGDPDICSMLAVIQIMEGSLDEAKAVLMRGLQEDSVQYDLLYNLAYIYEKQGRFRQAADLYGKAATVANSDEQKRNVDDSFERLRAIEPGLEISEKARIVFFVKQGMDNFLGDIINGLSEQYWVRKIIVSDFKQIDTGMEWTDVCWFEWCDELVAYGSKLQLARRKKIICRIHGYEVYTDLINKVDWACIDKLIIVAPHIKRLFLEKVNKAYDVNIDLIFCGIDVDTYPLAIREKGFNLGYLGYINFKKNLPLTLDIFKKLYDTDGRYKLYIAGSFQDMRTFSYFEYFIKEHGLDQAIIFDGWQDKTQKAEWLKKINYMLISSIDEGLCFAAAEAMCCGIKPILHNCEGIKDHYDRKYIFDSVDDAVEMICSEEYNSLEYRNYIKSNYSAYKEIAAIKQTIKQISISEKQCSSNENLMSIKDTFDLSYAQRYTARNEVKTQIILDSIEKEYSNALDIGCNEGYVINSLLKQSYAQFGYGIDLDEKVINKDLVNSPNFIFYEADISKFEFNMTYDLIIYNSVHHHIYGKYGKLTALTLFKEIIDHCNQTLIFETGMMTETGSYYWKDAISSDFSNDDEHLDRLFQIIGQRLKKVEIIAKLDIHNSVRPLLKISLHPIESDYGERVKKEFYRGKIVEDDELNVLDKYYRSVGSKNQKLINANSNNEDLNIYDETIFYKLANTEKNALFFSKKILLNDIKEMCEFAILTQIEDSHAVKLVGVSKTYGLIFPYLPWDSLDDLDYTRIMNADALLNEINSFFDYATKKKIRLNLTNHVEKDAIVKYLIDVIDLHPHNFMVCVKEDKIIDWKVIDFEYYSNNNCRRNAINLSNIQAILLRK